MTDHHDTITFRPIVVGRKRTADDRIDAQHPEEVRRDLRAGEPHRVTGARERHRRVAEAGERFEQPVALPKVQVVRIRQARVEPVPHGARSIGHDVQTIGFSKCQRPQNHALHDRKDGRVGADAQRKREQRDHGEGRPLSQAPRGESKILRKRLEPDDDIGVTGLFADGCPAAEPHERIAAGFVPGHPRRDVVADPGVDVELQFLVDLRIQIPAPDQIRQPIQPGH